MLTATKTLEDQDHVHAEKNSSSEGIESPLNALPRSEIRTRAPRYLVLGSDGNLGGYQREDVLLCDLAMNKRDGSPAVAVYKINDGFRTIYEPVTVEEIQAAYQEGK